MYYPDIAVANSLSASINRLIIDRVAGETIRLVASVCVRMSVGAVQFEPFDL